MENKKIYLFVIAVILGYVFCSYFLAWVEFSTHPEWDYKNPSTRYLNFFESLNPFTPNVNPRFYFTFIEPVKF